MKTFIYNESKNTWLEEDNLLYHDLCALLDENEKIMYLWNGPKSTIQRLEKGYESAIELVSDYPDGTLQLTVLTEDIPSKIQKRIDQMLEAIKKSEAEEIEAFSRLNTIRLFFIFTLLTIILPFISLLVFASSLAWKPAGAGDVQISAELYNVWLIGAGVLIVISLILTILNLAIGILEQEIQVIIFSVVGIIIFIGILIQLNQGIYIFLFQEGSTPETFKIAQSDLGEFIGLVLFALLIYELPNIYKIISFYITYNDYLFIKER